MKKTKEIKHQKSSNINTVKSSKLSFVCRPLSSILLVLRRLEFLGLYSYLKIQPSLGRRSSSFHGTLAGSSIKRLAKLRITGYFAVVALLFLSVATIMPIYNKPISVEATTGTPTASTLSYSATNTTASVRLNVTSKDGTFATSSDNEKIKFNLSTNNYTGYTLKVRFQDGVNLSNSNNSDNTLSSITSSVLASNFSANNATGESYNNKWGYIPSYYDSTANTDTYYPAATDNVTLRKTSTANSNNGIDNADNYSIGLGLRADYTNPSGTYTSNNTLILEYVANPVSYNITFSDDTGDGSVADLPSRLYSSSFSATSIILTNDKTPTRTGYTFSKWCLGSTNNNGTTCSGTEVNVGDSFGIDQTSSNSVTLYAVWIQEVGGETLSDITYMQEMTPEICANTPTPESMDERDTPQYELTDIRDNKTYTVSKLLDGNCWMTQNLALGWPYDDPDASDDDFPILTPEDSDVTEDFDFYEYADENYMHYANDIPRWNGDPDFPEYAHWDDMSDAMQYGNYYNYALATAYSSYDIGEGVAPSSICPKGWRLPTAGYDRDGEFSMLLNEYGWDGGWMDPDDFTNPPLSFGFPGFYDYVLQEQDNIGFWWSSSALDSNYYAIRMFGYRDGDVFPEEIDGYYGASIRCIARKTSTRPTITYDANGGTGAPSPTQATDSSELAQSITLSSAAPTKSGQSFVGWNTEQYGSGTWYQPGATIITASDITLYAMWVTPYTITYNANGGSGAPNPTTATVIAGSFNQTATIPSTIPTKSGQIFAGWNTKQDGSGMAYQPGATIITASDTTLYAIWATPLTDPTFKLNQTSIANITYMQEMNSTICSNMPQETQYQLKDSRDNKYYYVAKLKDGKCWMTQNLDLDLDNTKAFSSTNTNLANGTYWAPERNTIHTTTNAVSGWTNDYNHPYSADRGNVYSASGSSSSLTSIDCTVTGNTNCHYHIGNHYNWSAAVASNDTSSKTSGTASDSICPKGWRLPTGGSSGEYKALIATAYLITSRIDDTALRSSPLWFVRSGLGGSSLINSGSYGYYLSSTVYSGTRAYELYFGSAFVDSSDYNDNRHRGYSVRCVAE